MSEQELQFIKTHAPNMKDKDLAVVYNQHFNKSVTQYYIRKLRQKAGIRKSRGRGVNRVESTYNEVIEQNL